VPQGIEDGHDGRADYKVALPGKDVVARWGTSKRAPKKAGPRHPTQRVAGEGLDRSMNEGRG